MKNFLGLLIFLGGFFANAQTVGQTTPAAQPVTTNDETVELTSDTQVTIKVGEAKVRKSLLALTPVKSLSEEKTSQQRQWSADFQKTIEEDLKYSDYFDFLSSGAYLEDVSSIGLKPVSSDEPKGFHYEKWNTAGADFLVRMGLQFNGEKALVQVYAYSVKSPKTLLASEFSGKSNEIRKIAHTAANAIVESIAGQKGFFLSQIVVSSDKIGNKWKEIYVMDWDGRNEKKLTNHKSISFSPNWSPDGKNIVYTSFAYHPKTKSRNTDLFIANIETNKHELLSFKKGMNSGATFHPSGKQIYVTLSESGNPDIYSIDLNGENLQRLTNGPLGAMNVEPAVSPDGKRIAFSSDRSGQPMIWIMNIDGTNIVRKSFRGNYNASPAWSPDGKKIAFAGWNGGKGKQGGHFDIFIMDADGSTQPKKLTEAYRKSGRPAFNEDPSFSPDGRHVLFVSDRTGSKQLFIVSVDGQTERRITSDTHNYFRPKWSWTQH